MKFCPECGAKVIDPSKPVTCSKGHEVESTAKFCPMCGVSMAAPAAYVPPLAPRAEADLTSDEMAERKAAHEAAVRLGQEMPPVSYGEGATPAKAKTIVVHFLNDGFSVFGTVWYRGQEAEVWEGHPRWGEMQRLASETVADQYRYYGRQMHALGPWPGERSYTAGAGRFEQLKAESGDGVVSQPSEEELARADEAERRRGRRVPLPLGQ
jgi:ribosomal protein S27AE